MEIQTKNGKLFLCTRKLKNNRFDPYKSRDSVWYAGRKTNSSVDIITESKKELEKLQEEITTTTSPSSSKRLISLTNVLKNKSEKSLKLQVEQKPINQKFRMKSMEINKYDELRDELYNLKLHLFGRKMSAESFRMNFRPRLNIQPPREYIFHNKLVSFYKEL